jgi:hypothetical protein
MTYVYVVHNEIGGEVVGVFSTMEKAQAYADSFSELGPGDGTGHVVETFLLGGFDDA